MAIVVAAAAVVKNAEEASVIKQKSLKIFLDPFESFLFSPFHSPPTTSQITASQEHIRADRCGGGSAGEESYSYAPLTLPLPLTRIP